MFETDPVCHMQVMPETAAARYDYKGKTYYFCNPRCLERFKANPEQFLGFAKLETSDSKSRISNVIYTCPMHPEVRRMGPGACPKCGMALEPEMAILEEEANPELSDMTRRFWIARIERSRFCPRDVGDASYRSIDSGDARRPLGRLAFVPARLGVAGESQPKHVHADRDGNRNGLCI